MSKKGKKDQPQHQADFVEFPEFDVRELQEFDMSEVPDFADLMKDMPDFADLMKDFSCTDQGGMV